MGDDDVEDYGDTDPNNIPDDSGQGAVPPSSAPTSAGDSLPGYPVEGHPGWRAGVFGPGRGLLGMVRVSDLVARPGDDARLMRLSGPGSPGSPATRSGEDPYPMPPAYTPDGHGGVQLRPDFAATHPKGPFDFGAMAHNIDWGGVVHDLADIAWKSLPARWLLGGKAIGPAGSGALPDWNALAFLLGDTAKDAFDAQNKANKPGDQRPKDADRATNGLP